jgi:hypothetical protein
LRATFGLGLLTGVGADTSFGLVVHLGVWLVALGLFLGSMTRSCGVCALGYMLWQIDHSSALVAPASVFVTAVAIALVLVGPGGYSIDAFRYGRHVYRLRP